jgi:hypothetical protein
VVVLLLCSWLFRCLPAAETLFCSSFFRDSEHKQGGPIFFPKMRKKEGLEQEKSKDNAVRMDDGRYGTFCVEDLGFYCGSPSL